MADCLVEAEVMAKLHAHEAARIAFEQRVVKVLAAVDYDCAHERTRVHEDPLIEQLKLELPALAKAAALDGVSIALSCPVDYAPGSWRPAPGVRAELAGNIVGKAGEKVGAINF